MPLIINLPPEGTTIGNNSSENDFILFLQDLTLTTYVDIVVLVNLIQG